jgi:hypothetical protein
MAWSYDPAKLEEALNAVRFRIGDTETKDQQISNEEIETLLSVNQGDVLKASLSCVDAIIARYARFGATAALTARYEQVRADIDAEITPGYL